MLNSARRAVRYTIDLMSPADLALLRHAVVIAGEPEHQPEVTIVAWNFRELPGRS